MTISTTNELGKHPSKMVTMGLLENQQRKEQACSGLMETSQDYEMTFCH